MIQDADTSDGFTNFFDFVCLASLKHVAGVADDHLALGSFITTLDTSDLSIIAIDNFIDVLIEHESTTIDGAHSGETFRNTTETIDGIDERRVSVSTVGVHVELDLIDSFNGRSVDEVIISVEGNSVTNEINSVGGEIEFLDQSREIFLGSIDISVSLGICGIVLLNIGKEVFASVLLEETHQVGLESFFGSSGDFFNSNTTLAEKAAFLVLVDESTVNRLPFEVSGDSGLQKELDEVTISHDELGDEINIPVSVGSQLLRGFSIGSEKLPKSSQIQRSAFVTIVGISVDV